MEKKKSLALIRIKKRCSHLPSPRIEELYLLGWNWRSWSRASRFWIVFSSRPGIRSTKSFPFSFPHEESWTSFHVDFHSPASSPLCMRSSSTCPFRKTRSNWFLCFHLHRFLYVDFIQNILLRLGLGVHPQINTRFCSPCHHLVSLEIAHCNLLASSPHFIWL